MKLWFLKKLLREAGEKGLKIDATDFLNYTTVDDLINLLRELIWG